MLTNISFTAVIILIGANKKVLYFQCLQQTNQVNINPIKYVRDGVFADKVVFIPILQ